MSQPTLYLFGGCNGAGKTTFARAFLTTRFPVFPRFLNADEIARGLSPLDHEAVALKAGKLLLAEITGCIASGSSFGLESTLSGHAQAGILKKAKAAGFGIEIHFLWLPSPALSIRRVAQRVRKGGHHIPPQDIHRRYRRSMENFVRTYAPLSDAWFLWDNTRQPARLILDSADADLESLGAMLDGAMKKPSEIQKASAATGTLTLKERGLLAAKKMARDLRAEHKRWNMPLLTWKDGKVVKVAP